ncbi:hypothetical protein ACNKHL_14030 [Shigella flexneri]
MRGADGMVVNLLLEAIPDLTSVYANRAWTPLKGQQFARYVNPDYRHRIALLEEPCKTRDDSRRLPVKPALPLPGIKACASRNLPLWRRGRARGSYQTHAHGQIWKKYASRYRRRTRWGYGGDQFFH